MSETMGPSLEKIATGIPGVDVVTDGGLPLGRSTLVVGTAGSGKTLFALQYLVEGIRKFDEAGVFVTFEDSPADIRANVASFGWDLARYEEENQWAFVDATRQPDEELVVVGEYDLAGIVARIRSAVERTGATRVAIDSINALFEEFHNADGLRRELFRIMAALKELGVTSVVTAERNEEYGAISRHGIEEFVTDNVIILRHSLTDERRRRTIEVLKFRGSSHENGEFPFTVSSSDGMIVNPLSALRLAQASSTERITSGNAELDRLCRGGFFRDSVILVSGATGTGKTLLTSQFLHGSARNGDRCLLFAFEESRDQLVRNTSAWGFDFEELMEQDLLRIVNVYPHEVSLEEHLVRMKRVIMDFAPDRVAVDSLSALERVGTMRSFREFVINLIATLKQEEITGFFTTTADSFGGNGSITEKHVSTLTDTILLLRYVEREGRLSRALSLLKMRGSPHDTDIYEYAIGDHGLQILGPFSEPVGILGLPTLSRPEAL